MAYKGKIPCSLFRVPQNAEVMDTDGYINKKFVEWKK